MRAFVKASICKILCSSKKWPGSPNGDTSTAP